MAERREMPLAEEKSKALAFEMNPSRGGRQ